MTYVYQLLFIMTLQFILASCENTKGSVSKSNPYLDQTESVGSTSKIPDPLTTKYSDLPSGDMTFAQVCALNLPTSDSPTPDQPLILAILQQAGIQKATDESACAAAQAFFQDPKNSALNLAGKGITRVYPGVFKGLTAVKDLDLSDNDIKEIIEGAFSFSSLPSSLSAAAAQAGLSFLNLSGNTNLSSLRLAESFNLSSLNLGKTGLFSLSSIAFPPLTGAGGSGFAFPFPSSMSTSSIISSLKSQIDLPDVTSYLNGLSLQSLSAQQSGIMSVIQGNGLNWLEKIETIFL
ncbi:MAG: hypothetical protein K2X39_03885 [Silvanigrellaceae bacterium]|nr:hypothetical protein [Silvanigrellaceae bacterium]